MARIIRKPAGPQATSSMSAPQPARPGRVPVQGGDRGFLALAGPAVRLSAAPAPAEAPVQRLPATVRGQQIHITKGDLTSSEAIDELFTRLHLTIPQKVQDGSGLLKTQQQLNTLAAAIAPKSKWWHVLMDVLGRLVANSTVNWAEWDTAEAAEQQPWRQWQDSERTATVRTGVPPSTMSIPTPLYHMTSYTALPSIKKTGLDLKFVNSEGGLNAQALKGGDTKYAVRDNALNAVYLATTMGVAEVMDKEGASKVQLIIRVSESFRNAHLRCSTATGSAAHIDLEAPSTTILSFAPIPPALLFLRDPDRGNQERSLLGFPETYDWRKVAADPGSLKSLEMVQQEKETVRRRKEELQKQADEYMSKHNSSSSASPTPTVSPSATAPVFRVPPSMMSKMSEESKGDSDSDDSWPTE